MAHSNQAKYWFVCWQAVNSALEKFVELRSKTSTKEDHFALAALIGFNPMMSNPGTSALPLRAQIDMAIQKHELDLKSRRLVIEAQIRQFGYLVIFNEKRNEYSLSKAQKE